MSIFTVREGAVLRIWLDRASERNTLTPTSAAELAGALEAASSDDAVCAVLLAGRGDFFCYGSQGDLPERLCDFRTWVTKPVVAAVHGAVIGAGVGLAANAHVVVASQGTSFGLTEIRDGGWPAMFDAIARAVGARRASELAMTGRVFSTPEALQMGLVHEVAPAFEFEDRAEALASYLSRLNFVGRLPL